MLIDWNRLQPYKTTKQKSFEQLCYQIATKLFCNEGVFTPIDDSGGGDGVEFYLTRSDGDQWGWQAKYYESSPRLNVSNRKQQILKSFKKTIEIHPSLTIWYLCIPMDLTPTEKIWIDSQLSKNTPTDKKISVEFWTETFIHDKLNQSQFNGIKQAFFNELELSIDWFKNAFENSFLLLKNKFDDLLYVTNEEFEYWYVNPILCNAKFKDQRIRYYPSKLEELYLTALDNLEKLKYTNDRWRPLFKECIVRYEKLNDKLNGLLPSIKERYEKITPNQINYLSEDDYSEELKYLVDTKQEIITFISDWKKQNSVDEKTEDEKRLNIEQSNKIWDLEHVYDKFIEELRYYVSHSCIPTKNQVSHYLGNGGGGKTNFLIALAKQYLNANHPIIFIPAIKFIDSSPLTIQILTLLDIKTEYSFADFLDCLNELGKIYNLRIPILFDGLNEANNSQGFFNQRLVIDLPQLENEVAQRNNLVLLTTCRTSYKAKIWNNTNDEDKRFHAIYGFTNHEDKKKLIRTYFNHYKIQADLSFLSLERFTKPLYLKIFCESVNPSKKNLKQITLGYDSIYTIFENYVSLCDFNISKRIEKIGVLPPSLENKYVASRVLGHVAKHLWVNHGRIFSLQELMKLADVNPILNYNTSITKALLDEELLFVKNWNNGEESVSLTYDLMAGYFIAKYLIDEINNYESFLSGEKIELLLSDDYGKLHPNHEDIIEAICSLLPIKRKVFIHDIISQKNYSINDIYKSLFNKSIEATILLSPEYIPLEQINFIRNLSLNQDNLIRLINLSEDVFFVTNHPFNFLMWSLRLRELNLSNRDLKWSEYLRNLRTDFVDDLITEYESMQNLSKLTEEQSKKILLVSIFFIWTFTSTNKTLKEKTGNSIYKFGTKFPIIFFEQFYEFAEVADPTVFELLTIINYNITIVLLKSSRDIYLNEFTQMAKFLGTEILTKNGHYSTNHLLIRNYAFDTLQAIVRRFSSLFDNDYLETIKDHFKSFGTINWQESVDLNIEEYREGNSLIDYYFNKDKMPYLIIGSGNEYNPTPEYLSVQAKLRWRAYELGYDFAMFGEIDKIIANAHRYGGEYATIERYADKYIDVAFLEYCGYLQSLGKLRDYSDIGYLRAFKLKLDPTKTENLEYIPQKAERFVQHSYINSKTSLKSWGNDTSVPNVQDFILRDGFMEREGLFVLLNGFLHQHDKTTERQIFFEIDTIFVNKKSLISARKAFTKETKLGWASDSIPNTSHIHESEIPDADSIPYNEFTTWHYSLHSKTIMREYTKIELVENGKKLSNKRSDELWNKILAKLNYAVIPREIISGFSMTFVRFTHSKDEEIESIEDAFRKFNIELQEKKIRKQEKQEIDKEIKVFVPVRSMQDKVYLCKNMIQDLRLSSKFGSTDLFDENGNLASFNYTYYVEYVDQETFTYIRKDLLNKYLKRNNLAMFFIVWGERDYYPPDGNWMTRTKKLEQRKWAEFYQAIEYK